MRKRVAGIDPAEVVAGDAEAPALGGAGGEEDRPVALLLEVAQGEVATHGRVEAQLDAEAHDALDLLLEHGPRQPVLGDADGHHAARHRHRLEDRHG